MFLLVASYFTTEKLLSPSWLRLGYLFGGDSTYMLYMDTSLKLVRG